MPRSEAYIQLEIDQLETLLQSEQGLYLTFVADGVTRTLSRQQLQDRLDHLYIQRDRASGAVPTFSRGRIGGLG